MTPKGYLSWSQLSVWEASPKTYKKIYIDGYRLHNRGMELGSLVANSLETGEETGDIIMDTILSQFPRLESTEVEINCTLQLGELAIPLVGRIDAVDRNFKTFYEYKTGSVPWTQNKADKHGQITFYAFMIREKYKIIPKNIELIWAPTKKSSNGDFKLTGEIVRFKTQRTLIDIIKMKARIKKAWTEINEFTINELT